jgi:hypothetical protein
MKAFIAKLRGKSRTGDEPANPKLLAPETITSDRTTNRAPRVGTEPTAHVGGIRSFPKKRPEDAYRGPSTLLPSNFEDEADLKTPERYPRTSDRAKGQASGGSTVPTVVVDGGPSLAKPNRDGSTVRRSSPILPSDFDRETTIEEYKIGEYATAAVSAPGENMLSVSTFLDPEDRNRTSFKEHSHHNYFGPTTWVIFEVYKPADANYYLTMAIDRQLNLAREHAAANNTVKPTTKPRFINISCVVNEDTSKYLEPLKPEGNSNKNRANVPVDGFGETTFGKTLARLLENIGKDNGTKAHAKKIEVDGNDNVFISVGYEDDAAGV